MKKFSKIKRLGHQRTSQVVKNPNDRLVVKEKYDGANFRFTLNSDGELVFGSRNVEYTINGEPDYTENVDSRFKDAIEYVREKVDKTKLDPDKTYFGENMVSHSLDYNWSEVPQVIMFDIYDHSENEYVPWSEAMREFKTLNLPRARQTATMPVKDFDPEEYEVPESEYRDGKAEGVVIINVDQEEDSKSGFSTRAKMVTDEFAEKHKKSTGARQSKEAVYGHEKIVSKYCTDARIEKHVHKMRDEDRELGMELMGNQDGSEGLPVRVAKDILVEEADDIVRRNDTFNLKNFRSLVADRCVHELRQLMQKEAGGRTQ